MKIPPEILNKLRLNDWPPNEYSVELASWRFAGYMDRIENIVFERAWQTMHPEASIFTISQTEHNSYSVMCEYRDGKGYPVCSGMNKQDAERICRLLIKDEQSKPRKVLPYCQKTPFLLTEEQALRDYAASQGENIDRLAEEAGKALPEKLPHWTQDQDFITEEDIEEMEKSGAGRRTRPPRSVPEAKQCCERDHNNDGNCDRHPSGIKDYDAALRKEVNELAHALGIYSGKLVDVPAKAIEEIRKYRRDLSDGPF